MTVLAKHAQEMENVKISLTDLNANAMMVSKEKCVKPVSKNLIV